MEPAINLYSSNEKSELIRENSQEILSVLAAHQIALWEYDIITGKCSFSNDYFFTLGLKDAGIIFEDIDDFYRFIHPEDIEFYKQAFAEMLSSDSKTSQIRVRCISEQGKVIWLEDHFLSYKESCESHPGKLLAYTVNVTSQCEKEQHIKYLEEYNRKIIEALPEFIFIFDDNFFITDVLMAPGTILLHPVEVLRGADGRSIYSPEVSDLFICNIRECLRDGKLKEIEYPLEVDGSLHYFQARIAPFEGNRVLALIHDIGDRIQRSQELIEAKRRAEDADKMKSVFLANMSHEIRTPLNAIVGFSEIIAVTESEEEKMEYLEIIQRNSNLLLQLINDILDLSRIESGKSEMHFQQVEIAGLVEEVEKVHQLKMKSNVELKVIRPEGEYWTSTDRNRVMQVLFNFLSNAIKNTEKGSITLGLKHEGPWLKLYVSDTGCGISKEKLPQIFTRFEKLNDFVQGTGLGLSICKSIVERLGGRIEVTSELGQGSMFALYLPYQEIPKEVVERRLPHKKNVDEDKRKKILVVEDIESNFAQLNILLNKEYIFRYFTGIHQTQARSDKQRTGTAYHQKAINTRFLHSINNGQINFDCFIVYIRIIPSRIECTNNSICTLTNGSHFIKRGDIGFHHFQIFILYLYLFRMTNYCRNLEITIQCFIQKGRAHKAACPDKDYLFYFLHILIYYNVTTI